MPEQLRNITISPTLNTMDDIRLSQEIPLINAETATQLSVNLVITQSPFPSEAIIAIDSFYSLINNAQNESDFKKAWDLETSGQNGFQCREASGCDFSRFQASWEIWKVQYKLYDCGSNLVDAELRYYKRDPKIASTSLSPVYVRYQLVKVGGELKINKGQEIGWPGVNCTLTISVP